MPTSATSQSIGPFEFPKPLLVQVLQAEVLGLLSLLIAIAYTISMMDHGWWPLDDGTLGQAATRVLAGEIPHRDFAEPYTGGLTLLNALALALAGETLMALRMPLALLSVLWLLVCYRIARRYAPPWLAGLCVLAMATWALPNYPTPMPSWYMLFLATFAFYFGIRFRETMAPFWLALAGACASLSFLAKTTGGLLGLSLIAWLFGVFRVRDWPRFQKFAMRTLAASFLTMAVYLSVATEGFSGVYEFSGPLLAVALVLALPPRQDATEIPESAVAALITGGTLPLAVYFAWLLRHAVVDDFVNGVFVAPLVRVEVAARPLPSLITLPVLIGLAWLFSLARSPRLALHWRRPASFSILAALGLWWSPPVFRSLVGALAWSIPLLVFLGLLTFMKGTTERGDIVALGSFVLVTLDLVRFPFSSTVYFLYVAPFAILLFFLLADTRVGSATRPTALLLVGIVALAFGGLNGATLANLGSYPQRVAHAPLTLDRGSGLQSPYFFSYYSEVVPSVLRHSQGGKLLVYGDAPEIHFLTGQRNPGRHMYDFLGRGADPASEFMIEVGDIAPDVVVVKTTFEYAPPLGEDHIRQLKATYQRDSSVGPFWILWQRSGESGLEGLASSANAGFRWSARSRAPEGR